MTVEGERDTFNLLLFWIYAFSSTLLRREPPPGGSLNNLLPSTTSIPNFSLPKFIARSFSFVALATEVSHFSFLFFALC